MLKKHDLGLLTCRPSSLIGGVASGYEAHNDRSLSSGVTRRDGGKSANGKVLA